MRNMQIISCDLTKFGHNVVYALLGSSEREGVLLGEETPGIPSDLRVTLWPVWPVTIEVWCGELAVRAPKAYAARPMKRYGWNQKPQGASEGCSRLSGTWPMP